VDLPPLPAAVRLFSICPWSDCLPGVLTRRAVE
jgi:hypothetical protein